jgi:hypothetical protein
MKYTPAQRAEFYRKALDSLIALPDNPLKYMWGICNQLRLAAGDIEFCNSNFPELISRKPPEKEIWQIWWPMDEEGYQTRIRVLEECISEASELKKATA